ncbi:MAG: helix-turn-helix transcriptional regulator, partial [Eubacteriales bacterium]
MTRIKDLKEQNQQFGEFVKDRRASLGMSLRGLAGELGIAPSYLSDIEKGKRNPPVGDLLNKFIEALKLDGEMEWYLCE